MGSVSALIIARVDIQSVVPCDPDLPGYDPKNSAQLAKKIIMDRIYGDLLEELRRLHFEVLRLCHGMEWDDVTRIIELFDSLENRCQIQ